MKINFTLAFYISNVAAKKVKITYLAHICGLHSICPGQFYSREL